VDGPRGPHPRAGSALDRKAGDLGQAVEEGHSVLSATGRVQRRLDLGARLARAVARRDRRDPAPRIPEPLRGGREEDAVVFLRDRRRPGPPIRRDFGRDGQEDLDDLAVPVMGAEPVDVGIPDPLWADRDRPREGERGALGRELCRKPTTPSAR